MENKYNIDTDYLKNISESISKKLIRKDITKLEKSKIKADITTINEIINAKNNLFDDDEEVKEFKDITSLKEDFMKKAKKEFSFIGEDFIKFVISIYESGVLSNINEKNLLFNNNMDEILEKTLKLYSKYSKKLFNQVSNMLDKNSIQVVSDVPFSSFHSHIFALNKEFFIIDKKDYPYILSHEAFHGIEAKNNLITNRLFWEVGAILFEILYIDEEYNNKGINANKLYYSRINDCKDILEDLYEYFCILLKLKEKNFNINNIEFFDILSQNLNIKDDNNIINYLIYDGLYSKLEDTCYFASFLKALCIRYITLVDKKKGITELKNMLLSKKFDFDTSINSFDILSEYINSVNSKQKIMKK